MTSPRKHRSIVSYTKRRRSYKQKKTTDHARAYQPASFQLSNRLPPVRVLAKELQAVKDTLSSTENSLHGVHHELKQTTAALESAKIRAKKNHTLLRNALRRLSRAKESKLKRSQVQAMLDKVTREAQIAGWKDELTEISEVFNQSPLAQRLCLSLGLNELLGKLKGMNTDHASDQKKTYRLWQEWKAKTTRTSFGYAKLERMRDEAPNELMALLLFSTSRAIEQGGGQQLWDAMEPDARGPIITCMMEQLALELGTEIYNSLPGEEKRSVDLFFWAGCSMHKELNSVKGGNTTMMAWWKENDQEPPILLANKDNAAAIKLAQTTNVVSASVQRALDVSSRGGVKATSLAGAIFNHRDDKKGQQAIHEMYFSDIKGITAKFPDTSNTRYHSHCDAATRLIKYLDGYIDFLEYVRLNKDSPDLNHMEENLQNALRDPPTCTELAVLVLYSQAVAKPYLKHVCGSGIEQLNMLTLGPFHEKLKQHIKFLIENTDVLLNSASESTYRDATLDGLTWDDSTAIVAVLALYQDGRLPSLRNVLVAFLTGSLETWHRFTTEFEATGIIAIATEEETNLVFIPATNDKNEGLLKWGVAKSFITKSFAEAILTEEDWAWIRQKAREFQASGVEGARKKALIEHGKKIAEENRQKELRKKRKEDELNEKYGTGKIALVLDEAKLANLKWEDLRDQLEVHRRLKVVKDVHYAGRARKIKLLGMVKVVAQQYSASTERDWAGDVSEVRESIGDKEMTPVTPRQRNNKPTLSFRLKRLFGFAGSHMRSQGAEEHSAHTVFKLGRVVLISPAKAKLVRFLFLPASVHSLSTDRVHRLAHRQNRLHNKKSTMDGDTAQDPNKNPAAQSSNTDAQANSSADNSAAAQLSNADAQDRNCQNAATGTNEAQTSQSERVSFDASAVQCGCAGWRLIRNPQRRG
ncbi:hypothetical protein CONPUDRAFT_70533 [Coniophora puteana RWD-64-598 SS2]|uniref:Uncharacterized protein n=1 Tax=Coniophora puteana (strain RWD-64-598) TaxID=741705 RepID=A0A5M3N3G1_CONPW|nr:uncharacterized protein CONPUDRAFT_70533 [Coniophora puteana RWD-64-598 SS2]EIW85837.1 hypothetical protein CONPUDRAFT_70533 [Coniophora puteana RWD-64-598 SS2]